MILKTLHLQNFRKFHDAFLEFPEGITCIIGLNGVGKSTIIEAIAWTLYGPVAARTPAEQIKREHAQPSEPCRVELEFIFENDLYKITRAMTGKNLSASATAVMNGKIVAEGAEIVTKFIQKKLSMDYKSFYTSIFAKQKELNALSCMNPSERRPLILRMLGINQIDEVISTMRSEIKSTTDVILELEHLIVDKFGNKKTEQFQKDAQVLAKKKEETEKTLDQLIRLIRDENTELQNQEKIVQLKKTEYEKYQKTKTELEENKILYDRKKTLKSEIQTLENKIKERTAIIEQQKTELKKFDQLKKDIEKLQRVQQENIKKSQEMIQKIEAARSAIKQKQEEVGKLKQKKKQIEKIGPSAHCPTCDQKLEKQYPKLIKKFTEEIMKHNNAIEILHQKITSFEQEYAAINKERIALQKKQTYLQNQEIIREKILTSIEKNIEEIAEQKKELQSKKQLLEKVTTLKFNEQQYLDIKLSVEKTYREYQSSLEKITNIKDKIETLKIQKERKEGEKNIILYEIKNLQQKITEQQNLEQKITEEKNTLQDLKMTYEIMTAFRTYLISQIRPLLSQYASELFEQLTDGRYHTIELDEEYNILIYDNSIPYKIQRFSGGEEDLANLCIRLAISEVLTQRAGSIFRIIILDEIFGSQDINRRQNIIQALQKLSEKFKQIFLITHIEEIKNYTQSVIAVEEDENGISSVTIK
ncbi:MAG: SMC family ATPase [Candidatus Thermoplasmatota archaeon]